MHFRRPRFLAPLLLVALAACGGGTSGLTAPVFFVAGTNPVNGEQGVPVDQIVTVTLNKSIDPATVTNATLAMTVLGTPVGGTTTLLSANGQARTLRWIGPLQANTEHVCTIGSDVRSVDGDALDPPRSFSFGTQPSGGGGIDIPLPAQLRSAFGQLRNGRQGHAATRLQDGRVLVTGGFTQELSLTDRAEIFSPQTEQFTELQNRMVLARGSHTATLLADGRVLIAGGFVPGGPGQVFTTATAEIFDPTTLTFTPVGLMTEQRADHAAILLPDGRVLVTGGSELQGNFLADTETAEFFVPGALQFVAHTEAMIHTRATHGMVDMGDGRIAIAGGSDVDFRSEWFVIATELFEDLGQAAGDQGRFGAGMDSFASGGVAVASGDTVGTVLHIFEGTGVVQNTGSGLSRPRAFGTATRIKPDQIFVVGGLDFAREGFIEASCDVLIEGGVGGSRTFATQVRFDTGMAFHTATRLSDGRVMFCGGINADGSQPNLTKAYIFTPSSP